MTDPRDLGRILRDAIQKTVDEAVRSGPRNVAAAVNVGTDGQSTSVYSDQDVTIIQHNGETRVIRRDGQDSPEDDTDAGPGPAAGT